MAPADSLCFDVVNVLLLINNRFMMMKSDEASVSHCGGGTEILLVSSLMYWFNLQLAKI